MLLSGGAGVEHQKKQEANVKTNRKAKASESSRGEKRKMSKSAPESKSHSIVTACVNFHVCLLFDWR